MYRVKPKVVVFTEIRAHMSPSQQPFFCEIFCTNVKNIFFAPNFFNFFLENIENMFLIAYSQILKKNLQLKKKKKSHHILTWILVWRHFLDIF
jgi:hypothetical protein